jgi:hypothetical protein
MKSERRGKSGKTVDYPKLMIHKDGSFVVLFIANGQGTVVSVEGEDAFYCLGDNDENWNMDDFVPFIGEIVLIGEEE